MTLSMEGATSRFEASPDGMTWTFRGRLDFDNVVVVLAASEALPLPAGGRVELGGMDKADSAALAMLFALQRRARAEGCTLRFEGMPPGLAALARVYGVDELLASA